MIPRTSKDESRSNPFKFFDFYSCKKYATKYSWNDR